MKKFKKQTLIVISGLTMLMSAGAALSSTTSAAATIDWNTFAITSYGLGLNAAPSYTLNGQNSNTSSSVSDWVNWNGNTSNNSRSFSASTDGTGAGSGSASASRSANINILGTGFLVLSANYAINAAINENNNGGSYYNYDYNSASASVNFNLSNNSSISSGTSSSQANISLGTPWWYGDSTLTSDQKQGTLAVGVMVNNGDMLNFSSAVSANAHEINSIIFDPIIPIVFNPILFSGGYSSATFAYYYTPGVLNNLYFATLTPGVLNNLDFATLGPISYNLTAVPVPAALWLFSSALIGLVGLGRPRKAVMG